MRNVKGFIHSVFMGVALATIVVAAQTQNPQTPTTQDQKSADITVTGCVIQGSQPTTFLLDNARVNASDTTEKGRRYMLVSTLEDQPLKNMVNHEVTVTGSTTPKDMTSTNPPPAAAEKDLPVLTAKTVTSVSDRCTTAGR